MTLRAGLVGYGLAGQGLHAPLLRAAGFELAAVVTRDSNRAAAVRREHGAEPVGSLDELLARSDLDLVVIASPSGLHADQARQVIDAGVPVVVDKPLAVEANAAAALVERARDRKVPLTVFQNRRYDPEFATLRRVVDEGAVGVPVRLELRWERWRPVSPHRWREDLDWPDGGGLLLDLGTHLLDQAVQLFGPVDSVYAELSARTVAAEDVAFLALRHTSGMSTHVGTTSLSAVPGPRARLLGSRGAYLLASAGNESSPLDSLASADGAHGWLFTGSGERTPVPAADGDAADFYRALADALAGPAPAANVPVDPADAVHVLAVIDAARASSAQGRVVAVG